MNKKIEDRLCKIEENQKNLSNNYNEISSRYVNTYEDNKLLREIIENTNRLPFPWWVRLVCRFIDIKNKGNLYSYIEKNSNCRYYKIKFDSLSYILSNNKIEVCLCYLFPKFFEKRKLKKFRKMIENINNIRFKEFGFKFKYLKKETSCNPKYLGKLYDSKHLNIDGLKIITAKNFCFDWESVKINGNLETNYFFEQLKTDDDYILYIEKFEKSSIFILNKWHILFIFMLSLICAYPNCKSIYKDMNAHQQSTNILTIK